MSYYCPKHGWSHIEKVCPMCDVFNTSVSGSTEWPLCVSTPRCAVHEDRDTLESKCEELESRCTELEARFAWMVKMVVRAKEQLWINRDDKLEWLADLERGPNSDRP